MTSRIITGFLLSKKCRNRKCCGGVSLHENAPPRTHGPHPTRCRAIPVRKVSSKRTEPPSFAGGGGASGISSTRSFEGCAGGGGSTTPTAATSRLHQRSPSDGGLSRSASFRTPAGRSPYATVATASPRKTQRSSSVSAACPLASSSYSSTVSPVSKTPACHCCGS